MNITAAAIVIGNEILSGRIPDANLPYLGKRLAMLGIDLREARFVPDSEEDIVAAVNACRSQYRYVFTTGGIGPTHDDITTRSIAKAFNLPVERNPDVVARLTAYYGQAGLNDARLKMADIPVGATLVDDPVSSAPGFQLDNVFVLAGIPAIMQVMFESITYRLIGGPPILSRTVSTSRVGESTLAAGLESIQAHYPQLSIGSYPYVQHSKFGVRLVLRGVDIEALEQATDEVRALVLNVGGSLLEED